ncbi:MAG TPA: S8 family serine peptidase [Verrucomicrobiae bacterium]|nr:S8 family serine peptidase [Verrucomicrobiae bacterium]
MFVRSINRPLLYHSRRITRIATLSFLSGLLWFNRSDLAAAPVAPKYVEGEVIVQFAPNVSRSAALATASSKQLTVAQEYPWLSAHLGRTVVCLRGSGQTTATIRQALQGDPSVLVVEPSFLRHVSDRRPPNDPGFGLLWGLRNTGQIVNGLAGAANDDIQFLRAWGMARPSTNEIVVAVIDTGVDHTHPDLVSNMWSNRTEIPGNGQDDDANGYVDDIRGYDFADGDSDPMDSQAHGTHVAGTIAASGNNGVGVIGVQHQAHLMALKASSDGEFLPDSAILGAMQYAALMKSRGVNIVAINASYGGGGFSTTERDAIQAAGDVGIVFCAAAGNDSSDNDSAFTYPASYRLPNMIVVAASGQSDGLASFSNYGAITVDLAAPGVNILSTIPVSQYGMTSYVQQASSVFSGNELSYAGITSLAGITKQIFDCGIGNPTDFPAAVSNNIALIERGGLFFSEKVTNAMAAGAVAAVVYNNVDGNVNGTLQTSGAWIPAITISQVDGQTLLNRISSSGSNSVLATIVNAPDPSAIYEYLDGTSMAAPHVSGALAFAALNFPNDTPAQRIQRILTNVTPVPDLSGSVITGGRLNLARTVDSNTNHLPDWWEQQYFGQLIGPNVVADADQDGANNLAEWLAGTNPTNAASALRLTAVPGVDGNSVQLQWPSAPNRFYRLLSANFASGPFSPLTTNIAATAPLNTFTNPITTSSQRYYQLQVEP